MRCLILSIAISVLAGCSHTQKLATSAEHTKGKLTVTSPAFANNQPIPKEFTADGRNISPPLQWSPGPAGTQQYVVIMEDSDTRKIPFVHWIVTDLPTMMTSLSPGIPLPDAAVSAAFTANAHFA